MAIPVIDKSILKVGDIVGVAIETRIGWSSFRYPRYQPCTIARITPARTKFIMRDGEEYSNKTTFYALNEETLHQTEIANCACILSNCLLDIERLRQTGLLFKKDDETIRKASFLANDLLKLLTKEEM